MTTLAKIVLAILMALFMSSCNLNIKLGDGKPGNGVVTTETRSVTEPFTAIKASEGLDVLITQAPDHNIEVRADENIIDLIATEIKDGTLRIHARKNIGRATKTITVSLPNITALSSSSGASIHAGNNISANQLNLHASSGSDIELEAIAETIVAEASSGADIEITGKTQTLRAQASSGADIEAERLETQFCKADASSGGGIDVQVAQTLEANASSGGDIVYVGNPRVEHNKSVSGSVRQSQ